MNANAALPLWRLSQQPSEITAEDPSFSTAKKSLKCSQIPPHSSTQIPVCPSSPSVHFQEVKYTDPGCPAALYGKSLETPQSITVKPKRELTRENNHHGTSLKKSNPQKMMESRSERYSDENWRGTSKKTCKYQFLKLFIFHFLLNHIDQMTWFGESSDTGNKHTSCFWAFSRPGR